MFTTKATKNFNEEFVKALITFFPAESAYYYSLYNKHIYPIGQLSDVIKEYCDSIIDEDETMKIFKLGFSAKDCRRLSPESESRQDCFVIYNGRIIFSNYKHIFADSLDEFGIDFVTTETINWFIDRIYYVAGDDAFDFFDIFKDEVSKMPGSKDILSKMSANDVIDMSKIARRMLGRD